MSGKKRLERLLQAVEDAETLTDLAVAERKLKVYMKAQG